MPLLPNNRVVLPFCLALTGMLWARPAFADPPATPAVSALPWQKIVLQHVVPADILKALPAGQAGGGLPLGVRRLYAVTGNNALLVQATPAGLARLRELVSLLDIAPRRVQIQMMLAWSSAADLAASGIQFGPFLQTDSPVTIMGSASGPEVGHFAQTLRAQGAVQQGPTITTTNNSEASLGFSGQPVADLPQMTSLTYAVTPRVNSDDSITLVLHPRATWRVAGKTNPDGTPATGTQDFQTLQMLGNGQTWVLTNVFAGATGSDGKQLLLFVTPTVVSDGGGTVTVQKSKP